MRNEEFFNELVEHEKVGLFTPRMYEFFREHLQESPPRHFAGKYVVNNFIPPFPSRAFDKFLNTLFARDRAGPVIHSADLAVTNACMFNCYHCYNAGRPVEDLPPPVLQKIVRELGALGAATLCFTGGEPCLRADLPGICGALSDDCAGVLATTGYNFTEELAVKLKDAGLYSIAFSLDSADEDEHDRKRRTKGAFRIALEGIERSLRRGFYTYVCTVPTKRLLQRERFESLLALVERLGVPEIQVIEPAPSGRLLNGKGAHFGQQEFELIRSYMKDVNSRPSGPIVTSFAHIESGDAFGCGAGTSHVYVDGTGEVSPCNMLPVSYGNAAKEPLLEIVERMKERFSSPCTECLAHVLRGFFRDHAKGTHPVPAEELPDIPRAECEGELPRFFRILSERDRERTGPSELKEAYDKASESYDDYWLSMAAAPIDEMFHSMPSIPNGTALDCGCGTGYATERLLHKTAPSGSVLGVDLSPGMIEKARARLSGTGGLHRAAFKVGDVLQEMRSQAVGSCDAVTMTWLIGYVSCGESFPVIHRLLRPGGLVGFVAHLARSPRIPMEEFEAVAKEKPESLQKFVEFSFPADTEEVEYRLSAARLHPVLVKEGTFDYVCQTGREVYDHLMKSGAGTTYWLALKPQEREAFTTEFIRRIEKRFEASSRITIEHRYVLGIARAR